MTTACSAKESAKPSATPSAAATAPTAKPEITTGTNVPEGFPSDIPIVSDAKIISSLKKSADTTVTYTVTYETKMKIENVRANYISFFETGGYKDVANMGTEHNAILNGSRDNGETNLSVAATEMDDRLQVTLQYATKK
jgi:hypothetical protein